MSEQSPAKKRPALTITSTAREQAKHYGVTKAMVLDVMKNKTNTIRLDNGLFKFTGSPRYPNTHITVGFSSQKQKWVITSFQIVESVPKPAPKQPPEAIVKRDQRDTSLPTVIFTNHSKEMIKRESLDYQIIEHIIQYPDSKQYEDDEKIRFIGKVHGSNLNVIAKFLPKERKWLVITVELRYKHESEPLADISSFDGEPTDEHPGVMFTTHALERMALRKIYPDEVKQTILYPQKTFEHEEGKVKFIGKELSLHRAIHVVGRFIPEENKWLTISTWIRGEEDDGSLSTWKPQRKQSANGHPQIVFTNNMRKWMQREHMNQSHIEQIILNPYKMLKEKDGTVKFIGKTMPNSRIIHVIGKFLPQENKWLVITALKPRRQQYRTKNEPDNISLGCYLIVLLIIAGAVGYPLITSILKSTGF